MGTARHSSPIPNSCGRIGLQPWIPQLSFYSRLLGVIIFAAAVLVLTGTSHLAFAASGYWKYESQQFDPTPEQIAAPKALPGHVRETKVSGGFQAGPGNGKGSIDLFFKTDDADRVVFLASSTVTFGADAPMATLSPGQKVVFDASVVVGGNDKARGIPAKGSVAICINGGNNFLEVTSNINQTVSGNGQLTIGSGGPSMNIDIRGTLSQLGAIGTTLRIRYVWVEGTPPSPSPQGETSSAPQTLGYQLYFDGKLVSGPDAASYSYEQALQNCTYNMQGKPGIGIRCVYAGKIFSERPASRASSQEPGSLDQTSIACPTKTSTMTIQVCSATGKSGDTISIPVWLISGSDLANVNVDLSYVSTVAQASGKASKGSLLGKALFESNVGQSGIARFGFAGSSGLNGTGQIATIPFKIVGNPGQRTPLQLKITSANSSSGATMNVAVLNGEIVVAAPGSGSGSTAGTGTAGTGTAGTGTTGTGTTGTGTTGTGIAGIGTTSQTYKALDAMTALKMSVGLIPQDLKYDLDKNGQITSNDARLILMKTVGK